MSFLIGVAVGLVIGWNFLAQPASVKGWVESIKTKLGR